MEGPTATMRTKDNFGGMIHLGKKMTEQGG